jgi:iron complex outermembrane receptor protein
MIVGLNSGTKCARIALALSASSLCWPSLAAAQQISTVPSDDTVGAEQSQDGEIIVTAQRRSERLQDVPIAISALGDEDLAQRGVVDVGGLRGAVPGLSITYSAGINASNLIAIRGVSGLPSPIGTSQATAIYLDGVYLSRPNAAFFSLDDVERIEVLRGPQGALYGRNATAGAINIITRLPGDSLRGGLDVSYGNFNTVNARGSLSGPLGGGFSAGVSGSFDRHDGYFLNTVTGNRVGNRKSYTIRGTVHYVAPDDNFSAVLSGDYSKVEQPSTFRNQYSSLAPNALFTGIGDPDVVSFDALSEARTRGPTKSGGVAFTMNLSPMGGLNFTSITSYRKVTAIDEYDLDGSALPAIFSLSSNSSRTFNQEIRGVLSTGPINLTAGANFFDEKGDYALAPFGPPTATFGLVAPINTTHLKAYAVFGQLEYEVVEGLTLVGGIRFNREERDFTIDYTKAPVAGAFSRGQVSDSALIPSAGVNWKAAADLLLYAKVSRGYQAPGFNAQPGIGSATSQINVFNAEDLTAYESGLKSQFFDRRITFNAAGFWYDYKGLQVRNTIAAGITQVNNAASARVKGFEASLAGKLVAGLTVSGHVTYSDARYGSFCEKITGGSLRLSDPLCSDPTAADRSGNRLTLAPKWTGGISGNYTTDIAGAGTLTANVSYSWEANSFFSAANDPVLSTQGWERIDGRIGFQLNGGPEIYVYGKNLSDTRYSGFALRATPTFAPAQVSDPRTYGIGVRYHF